MLRPSTSQRRSSFPPQPLPLYLYPDPQGALLSLSGEFSLLGLSAETTSKAPVTGHGGGDVFIRGTPVLLGRGWRPPDLFRCMVNRPLAGNDVGTSCYLYSK